MQARKATTLESRADAVVRSHRGTPRQKQPSSIDLDRLSADIDTDRASHTESEDAPVTSWRAKLEKGANIAAPLAAGPAKVVRAGSPVAGQSTKSAKLASEAERAEVISSRVESFLLGAEDQPPPELLLSPPSSDAGSPRGTHTAHTRLCVLFRTRFRSGVDFLPRDLLSKRGAKGRGKFSPEDSQPEPAAAGERRGLAVHDGDNAHDVVGVGVGAGRAAGPAGRGWGGAQTAHGRGPTQVDDGRMPALPCEVCEGAAVIIG